ncbi:MAG: PQQ-dependent sugar dehydrogenase, partial [Deltaproteobacteria bacterium]|nr:PQQ-dependent sugar dehydrogenase [Deltaproteobacteria bacterium]
TSDLEPLPDTETIEVEDDGERGLLNVAADPDYSENHFIYLFYTPPAGDLNQVDRFTVSASAEEGTFSLSDRQTVISFDKNEASGAGTNHNGGGMDFDEEGSLVIGVGDGGGTSSYDQDEGIVQNLSIKLGKIHRILPNRNAGEGGYTIPDGNNTLSDALDEIYAYGLRNPFTLVSQNGVLFIGDVGRDAYEEINLIEEINQNFGWPDSEGPTTTSGESTPLHYYAHGDTTFSEEDPEENDDELYSVMVGHFYTGSQYDGGLDRTLIYSDFYNGWVRGLKLDENYGIVSDRHLGHLTGMTSLQEGPDGFLYAVSLFGSSRILRVDVD